MQPNKQNSEMLCSNTYEITQHVWQLIRQTSSISLRDFREKPTTKAINANNIEDFDNEIDSARVLENIRHYRQILSGVYLQTAPPLNSLSSPCMCEIEYVYMH